MIFCFSLFFLLTAQVFYSQENPQYELSWKTSVPALSHINKQEIKTTKYHLMEIDLAVDLRKQALHQDSSPITLSQNQFITSSYNVAIPKNQFKVSINGNNSYNPNNGGIKNNAYKDASLYSGAFCPITGILVYQ